MDWNGDGSHNSQDDAIFHAVIDNDNNGGGGSPGGGGGCGQGCAVMMLGIICAAGFVLVLLKLLL